MSALRTLWFGFLALAVAFSLPAAAQDYPPRPEGPVYDGADMLSPATEAALDQKLRAYNRDTGRSLVVATVPNMGGVPLETYSIGLATQWGIGGADRDQGLLLLVAKEERDIRIEVGYGLHVYFGGIMAGRIIRNEITPRFKEGDFDGGVTAGIDAITAHLAKSPAEAAAIEEAERTAEAQDQGDGEGFPFGFLIWLAFIGFFFVLPAIARGGRRYRGGGGVGSAVGNVVLWTALNAAMNSGRGGGSSWGGGGGGFSGGGGGGGFGGFGGGMSGGGGASGGW